MNLLTSYVSQVNWLAYRPWDGTAILYTTLFTFRAFSSLTFLTIELVFVKQKEVRKEEEKVDVFMVSKERK